MKLLKSKGLTQVLCVTLCLLCTVVCVISTGITQQKGKQVKEPLSAKSELPKNQVIVYRIYYYYNEKDSPTIKVEHGNADTPISLKGSNDGSNHGG